MEGKAFYVFSHAYHHFLVEIVEMLGPQRARCRNIRRIQSCQRGWTDFFRDGCESDTTYTIFPDGELTWFNSFEWNHPIPGAKK